MALQDGDGVASHPAVRSTPPLVNDVGIVARLAGLPLIVTIAEDQPNTAVVTRVAQAVIDTLFVAADGAVTPTRKTVSIFNEAAPGDILYVLLGTGGVASAINYTVRLNPGDLYETSDPNFVGEIHGIWSGAGAGAAMVTVESRKK